MKTFHELLKSRRSIRKYTDEALSPEDVRLILEAALMAPSSKRSTGWEFIVIEEKKNWKNYPIAKNSEPNLSQEQQWPLSYSQTL